MWDNAFPNLTGHCDLVTCKEYWIQESKLLSPGNHLFNEFFIDVFRRMLLQQGFQDENELFCLSHITVRYLTSHHHSLIHKVSFQPKWRFPHGVDHCFYIGKKFYTHYSILPNDDKLQFNYTIRTVDFKGSICCKIYKEEKTTIDKKDHNTGICTNAQLLLKNSDHHSDSTISAITEEKIQEEENLDEDKQDSTSISNMNNQDSGEKVASDKGAMKIHNANNAVTTAMEQLSVASGKERMHTSIICKLTMTEIMNVS